MNRIHENKYCKHISLIPIEGEGARLDKFKKKIRIGLRADVYLGIFLGLIWGQILYPPQVKTGQIFPIPKFLVLLFGENFMKILPKISMLYI